MEQKKQIEIVNLHDKRDQWFVANQLEKRLQTLS